jgi:hypothetical protein
MFESVERGLMLDRSPVGEAYKRGFFRLSTWLLSRIEFFPQSIADKVERQDR